MLEADVERILIVEWLVAKAQECLADGAEDYADALGWAAGCIEEGHL